MVFSIITLIIGAISGFIILSVVPNDAVDFDDVRVGTLARS